MTYYGQELVTLDDPQAWWTVTASEILNLMLKEKFEVDYIDIGKMPAKRFGMGIRVIHFDSDQELVSYLRL